MWKSRVETSERRVRENESASMNATEFLGKEGSQSTHWIWRGAQGGEGMHGMEVETEGGFPRFRKGRRSKENVVDTEVG